MLTKLKMCLLTNKVPSEVRDDSLRCRPGKTPTWANRLYQAEEDWAEKHWWNPVGEFLFNIPMALNCWGINLAVLYVISWPILKLFQAQTQLSLMHLSVLIATYFVFEAVSSYMQPDVDPKDELPPKEIKKVAIIGAGPSGLCVAKELLAEGHIPVVFEKGSAIGGVWQRQGGESRGCVLENTVTSSSALNTAFSDFPIQAENPGPDPFFMKQTDYMDYLHRYAKYFGVDRRVRLKTEVLSISQLEKSRWQVKTLNARGKVVEEEFDAVSVCAGQTAIPRKICIPGQESFSGVIQHSSELHSNDSFQQFKGKRVLVVGAGETASDMVLDIVKNADCCDVSVRNPVLVLHRNLWGVPPDYAEPRTMYQSPRWVRWATYKSSVLTNMLFMGVFARTYKGKTIRVPSVLWLWKLLFTRKLLVETVAGIRSACSSVQTTKSDNIMFALQNKEKCSLKPGIDHIDADGNVVFTNNQSSQYDFILLTTGYQPSRYPFLPEAHQTNHLKDRYLGVFHPELSNMAFIGYMRGNVGALILGFELQARWFALLCSEKRTLPENMQSEIDEAKKKNDSYNGTSGVWFYANYLARHHVRCEPNFLKLFIHHPITAIKAYCGNFTSYQFRMRGPHRDIQAVVDGYGLTDGIFWIPLSRHVLHILWTLQGPFFQIWSRVPIVGILFKPMLDQWY